MLTEALVRVVTLLSYLPRSISENVPTSEETQALRQSSFNCDNGLPYVNSLDPGRDQPAR